MKLSNAQIGNISTMADWGIKITIYTPELPPEEMIALFMAKKGWLIEDLDIPETRTDSKKSPSERLRSVLYIYWENNMKNTFAKFDTFYLDWMDKKIDQIKERLPARTEDAEEVFNS